MSNVVWLAEMDTRNFSFRAHASTKEEAVNALVLGLDVHRAMFNLKEDWYDLESDVNCECYVLGAVYRDGMESKPLYTTKES